MKFSVLRLILAFIPAAAAFGFLRWLGHDPLASAILGLVIGGALVGIVLIATKHDFVQLALDVARIGLILIALWIVSMVAIYGGVIVFVVFLFLICPLLVFFVFFLVRKFRQDMRRAQRTDNDERSVEQ